MQMIERALPVHIVRMPGHGCDPAVQGLSDLSDRDRPVRHGLNEIHQGGAGRHLVLNPRRRAVHSTIDQGPPRLTHGGCLRPEDDARIR